MRFFILVISLIFVNDTVAQNIESIEFKYKKLNIPPVTSLDISYQFFFFSSNNLLWFSTRQGLTSFDGIETISYYPDTSESAKYELSNIRAMAEDKNKNLWIASRTVDDDPALSYFNTNTRKITRVNLDKRKKTLTENENIKALFIDSSGLLWMSTYRGFYIYNTNDSTIEYYIVGPRTTLAPYYDDPEKMWLSTVDGIFLFSLKTRKTEKVFAFPNDDKRHTAAPQPVIYMEAANDSILYLGTEYYGMGIYNTKRNTLTMFPPYPTPKKGTSPHPTHQDGFVSFARKSKDEYYLCYIDSLPIIFNYRTQKYTRLNIPGINKELKKGVVKLVVDKKGNLWMGESNYLYVISNEFTLFKSQDVPYKLDSHSSTLGRFSNLVWDNELKCFYATFWYSNQIYQLDSNFRVINTLYTPFPAAGNKIILIQDGEKRVWAVNNIKLIGNPPPGISVYKRGDKGFRSLESNGLPKLNSLDKIYDLTSDNKGNLIFSNAKGDLFFLNAKTFQLDSLTFPEIDSSKQFERVNAWFQYLPNCNCVSVSNGKNVLQYNIGKKTAKVFTWDSSMYPKKDNRFHIYYDSIEQIWIRTGTRQGFEFQIYDGETFRFKRKIELRNSRNEKLNIINMMSGPIPYMFLRLEEGMALYNYEDNTFRLFDKDNGLLSDLDYYTHFVNNTYIFGFNKIIQYVNFNDLVSLTNQRSSLINKLAVYSGKVTSFPEVNNGRVQLDYNQNTIGISFSAIEYLFPERVQYAFRLLGLNSDWRFSDYKSREIVYSNLSPGKHTFQLKAQILGGNWQSEPVELIIIITPPFWKTWWFRILAGLFLAGIVFFFIRRQIANVRRKEQQKSLHEKELLELEAKALRAQMNPHFIFNSMNSIKSLINKNENEKAANYLTTFSKLIRTLFQNSDKREVSLYEELQTCKFYTQLEKMRFADKLEFVFNIDETIDLKDFKVPALILQPFIENAIWHGLIPKEAGGKVVISATRSNEGIKFIIDDNGIGREQSKQFKPQYEATYQSKGIGLTQSRLELDKLLNEREDTISIIDKKNELGQSEGTKVIITFKENMN